MLVSARRIGKAQNKQLLNLRHTQKLRECHFLAELTRLKLRQRLALSVQRMAGFRTNQAL
jgi:hypothetical protein